MLQAHLIYFNSFGFYDLFRRRPVKTKQKVKIGTRKVWKANKAQVCLNVPVHTYICIYDCAECGNWSRSTANRWLFVAKVYGQVGPALTWVKWSMVPGGKSDAGGVWSGWWGHVLNIRGRALIILYGPAHRPKADAESGRFQGEVIGAAKWLFPSPDLQWGLLLLQFSNFANTIYAKLTWHFTKNSIHLKY